jgi:hypothetical protein
MDNKTQAANKRRRARKPNGEFRGDNPDTKLNQAWEPTPIEPALADKTVGYAIKQKVVGTSQPTAGKYGKKVGIRPTFGNVTSTTY